MGTRDNRLNWLLAQLWTTRRGCGVSSLSRYSGGMSYREASVTDRRRVARRAAVDLEPHPARRAVVPQADPSVRHHVRRRW